jgi:phospholipid/cholesterol/gamma-HCH transport system substrate-binding protein
MTSSRVIVTGAFVLASVALFAVGLFMIGERRLLFERRFSVFTEFAKLGELEVGAVVRVAGAAAGEVTGIQIPQSPTGKFRVRMDVREDLHGLVRTDSIASTETEGLLGAVFVNIGAGTEKAPPVPRGGTIPSREPFSITDLLQQTSDTITLVNQTVLSLRGDVETAVQQIALTAEDTHGLVEDLRPDLVSIARQSSRIAADMQQITSQIRQGNGTLGKLVNDDALYRHAEGIAERTRSVATNLQQVTDEARKMLSELNSKEGSAGSLMVDMRATLAQAREAVSDLAENMEALKRNFLFRGFFNKRGYFDLSEISPAEYRSGLLEQRKRTALRIWLSSHILFDPGSEATLTDEGRVRLDSAIATYLRYLPSSPLVVEGYSTEGSRDERFRRARQRARVVREYLLDRYALVPQATGLIGLGNEAPGSPAGDQWDGVALALFVDRESLQSVPTTPRVQMATKP